MNVFEKCTLFFPIFLSAALLAGCAGSGKDKKSHTEFCREKYEVAEDLFKRGKYGRAQDKLEDILSVCAGTGYMEKSQFLLAESYFNLEDWIEARGEYGSFVLNFPGSPFAETAAYRKAVSSYNMEFRVSRDESNTTTAMKDFERYLDNYPETPLRDSVNYYYEQLVERLAEKEFQTARLYMRMDKPQATVIYLKEFLDNYPKSKRRKESLFMISEAYTKLDQFEAARSYLDIARNDMGSDKDVLKKIEKTEKKIAKAETKFAKKLKKDAEKNRVQKEEKEMTN
jgi:outer membrane protein assembly factor BamD